MYIDNVLVVCGGGGCNVRVGGLRSNVSVLVIVSVHVCSGMQL